MMIIGETTREAVDWVQEKLDYARRDIAEITLTALLESGMAKSMDEGVFLLEEIPEGELREKSRQAVRGNEIRRNNRFRRRSVPTKKLDGKDHNHKINKDKITDLNNYVDPGDDTNTDPAQKHKHP